MFVIYKGSIWELPNFRSTLFNLLQEANPDQQVWIYQDNAKTKVRVIELIDYSTDRNRNALKKEV